MVAPPHDLIILGGGLAGGLSALAVLDRQPDFRIVIVEPGARLGGNHLWSFFDSDLTPPGRELVAPLVVHRWPGYEVRFPAFARRIGQPYRTIESEALDLAVRERGVEIVRARALGVTSTEAVLVDGTTIAGKALIDCRGFDPGVAGALGLGWQKFAGQLLDIPAGHGVTEPVVMDATVDQSDGYRFVYCLPFDDRRLFVEDTYYHDAPDLDPAAVWPRIGDYAREGGWTVETVLREESGLLPVVCSGRFDTLWPTCDAVARGGIRAGLFHPLTSYSLPEAVRQALWLADSLPLSGDALAAASRARAKAHWRRAAFDRMLARMLFRAARPAERYRVLQRFYRLPAPLIARFYAGRSTGLDRLRILAGKPPVPVGRAVRAMMETM